MKIIFTKHAEFRMKKRGILKQEVIDAVNFPNKSVKKQDKYYIQKKLERGTIEVCCEKSEKYIKIVTIYWI